MKPASNWEERYLKGETGWDIGAISDPLKAYIDQLEDKSIRILIPGGGNGYEAAYFHQMGFKEVYLLDLAPSPLSSFRKKHPDFSENHLICENFFEHEGNYDLIIEQTFFCAIQPKHRPEYAKKVHSLLLPKGKLVGLLWSVPMNKDHPPFGGNMEEYRSYFDGLFDYIHFEEAYNSIPPRAGRELFLCAKRIKFASN